MTFQSYSVDWRNKARLAEEKCNQPTHWAHQAVISAFKKD